MSAEPCQLSRSSRAMSTIRATSSSALVSSFKKLFRANASSHSLNSTSLADEREEGSNSPLTDGPLTDQDIDEVVFYLLEKLNDYSEELNQLSIAKESVEKQLKSFHRSLLRQLAHIKQTYGNRALALLEIYFEKMLRLCMRDLELQHCYEMQSDMEDELHIAGSTIEQFDLEAEAEICLQRENILHGGNCESQLAEHLQPSALFACSSSDNRDFPTNAAHLEIVQKMRVKIQNICEQLGSLHDKISTIRSRQETDRLSFDRFCKLKHLELQPMTPLCNDFFDTRMSLMMLKPKLDRLTTKIVRTRCNYSATMNDLYLVSCYIRQYSHKRDKQQQLVEANNALQ